MSGGTTLKLSRGGCGNGGIYWAYTFIGGLRPMMKSHMERQWEVRGANKDSTDNTDLYCVYPMLHGRELVAL